MTSASRQIGVELFIGVASCAAAYLFIVQPLNRRVGEAEARNDQFRQQIASYERTVEHNQAGGAEKLRAEAEALLSQVRRASAAGKDEGSTFESLMALATRHHVQVDQLQPGTPRASKQKPAPDQPPQPTANDRRSAVSMTIVGEFADVVGFVRSLETELGFASVRSLRLTPMNQGDKPGVHASIETEHLWIDTGRAPAVAGAEARP